MDSRCHNADGLLSGNSTAPHPYAPVNWQSVDSLGHRIVIQVPVIDVGDDNGAYKRYCADYLEIRPDAQLPSLEELADFVEYKCPPEAIAEANVRLAAILNTPSKVACAVFHHNGQGESSEIGPKTLCAVSRRGPGIQRVSLADILRCFDEARCVDPEIRLNPLAPLVMAWQKRYRPPGQIQVLTAGQARLTRMPNHLATVALSEWEETPDDAESPDLDLLMATVDGVPVASATATQPEFRKPRRPKRTLGQQQKLFDLPGNRHAESLVLLLMRSLEREIIQEADDIDRRYAIHSDVFFTLSLACALTTPLTVSVDTYGAWLTGRYTTKGIKGAEQAILRKRAFQALDWARGWVITEKGYPLALLDVGTVGLLEGTVELRPWGWGFASGAASVGWRLTGAVANAATRAAAASDGRTGEPGHSRAGGYGTFGRIVAALDDFIGASGRVSRTDSRDRLLVPVRRGGPGPVGIITAGDLLARAGLVWDQSDKRQASRARQLWKSTLERFEHGGYILGNGPGSEAPAGDTVEVVEIIKGHGKRPGALRFRASARFVEAYTKVKNRGNGGGLDHTPLPEVFKQR